MLSGVVKCAYFGGVLQIYRSASQIFPDNAGHILEKYTAKRSERRKEWRFKDNQRDIMEWYQVYFRIELKMGEITNG
jgi:hypothetical protein